MLPTGSRLTALLVADAPQRWFGRLLATAIAAAACWYAAGVFWKLFSPAVPSVAASVDLNPVALAARVSARHMFGESAAPAVAQATAASLTLRGIIAGDRPGGRVAIIAVEGQRAASVREGEDIQPGLRLERVSAASIEISRNGIRETIALPTRTSR